MTEIKIREDVNLPYSMAFLVERYGVTQQALNKFVNKNIKKINKDGEHARKVGKEWRFDDVALTVIDYLKDKKKDASLPAIGSYESPEAIRIKELEVEVERLAKENAEVLTQNNALIITNGNQANMLAKATKQVEELEGKVLQLNAAEADNKLKADQIAELQAESKQKDERIEALESESQANLDRAMQAESREQASKNALAAEQNKSLWQLVREKVAILMQA
ncbi:MAG: hypothetical protein IKT51_05740 [Phascolarctobacterium sp.]|nr:hypothetical protein [Phascolarctobacterium sp.]